MRRGVWIVEVRDLDPAGPWLPVRIAAESLPGISAAPLSQERKRLYVPAAKGKAGKWRRRASVRLPLPPDSPELCRWRELAEDEALTLGKLEQILSALSAFLDRPRR